MTALLLALASAITMMQPGPETPMRTRFADDVSADQPLAEYPRPQLVREQWTNLNGPWEYALTDGGADQPADFEGEILVPFPIESHLSGVQRSVQPTQSLWYRRTFDSPAAGPGRRVLLHFGAVDWETTVFVNGTEIGRHRGGYDPFSFDITDALTGTGTETLVVRVTDPTDQGAQPRGKQVLSPQGIFYTAVTGIWQTVWLETVPENHISRLHITPEFENHSVTIRTETSEATDVSITVFDGDREVASADGVSNEPIRLAIPDAKAWSPGSPFLYDLRITAGDDAVASYFGLRDIDVRMADDGYVRLFLNGKPTFHFGLLDQGWWPDGLYTAPTDEALRYDIEMTLAMGFNMARKHVKVEPARWYYWADRLGLLVWQDMPSFSQAGEEHFLRPGSASDLEISGETSTQFRTELRAMIDALRNHPSIVVWVPFNEGWGQHDTNEILQWVIDYDPTRLVDGPSGWQDFGVGHMHDMHNYPGPGVFDPVDGRAAVLGEFGGLGLPMEGHLWQQDRNWGYRTFESEAVFARAYRDLIVSLRLLIPEGLAAAVYTQTTDVEGEVNGLMTYDRAVTKISPNVLRKLHAVVYARSPVVDAVLPTSQRRAMNWRYTTQSPGEGWEQPDFDDSEWKSGPGGFGTDGTPGAVVRTTWDSSDIWLRRSFNVPASVLHNDEIMLSIHHDEDAEVYLNGQHALSLLGYTTSYRTAVIPEGLLRQGENVIAIHCRQTTGGQYIDAGLLQITERR